MKILLQFVLGVVLLVVGLVLVLGYPDDEVLWWTGRPLGILVGALGLVYGGGAVWQAGRRP